jgi:hypothetical protein
MAKSIKKSASNALDTPGASLKNFNLLDLQVFTKEQMYSPNASKDFHLFYVGRDDVHDILKYVLSRVTVSLYLNMFGYDDDELNTILWAKALDPTITMLITLDKSQSTGVHEKKLLDSDIALNPTAYNTHFVVGTSSTGQISHTKGFVADGIAAGEGSTNWSVSGEGTFIISGKIGGPGYKAQNNTQSIITDPDTISSFTAELIAEHLAARAIQPASLKSEQRVPEGTPPKPGMLGMNAATTAGDAKAGRMKKAARKKNA